MAHINENSKITRNNMSKKIDYPEHKLKNVEAIVKKDSDLNVTLINKTKEFFALVKEWEQDQHDLNFKRKRNKQRTLSPENFKEKLDKKEIATSYTFQENAIFLKQKFNNSIEKISQFYKFALDAFIKEVNIPKKNIINAIIHFDQTTPHLHFAISNIHEKISKDQNRIVKTVNTAKIDLIQVILDNKKQDGVSYQKWENLRRQRIKYEQKKISISDWDFYLKNNYSSGFLSNIEKKINNMYKNKNGKDLYQSYEDYIFMDKIRGFSNKDIEKIGLNLAKDQQFNQMKKNLIFQSRKTTIDQAILKLRYRKNLNNDEISKIHKTYINYLNENDIELSNYFRKKLLDKICNKEYAKFVDDFRTIIPDDTRKIYNDFLNKWTVDDYLDEFEQYSPYSLIFEAKNLASIFYLTKYSDKYLTKLDQILNTELTEEEFEHKFQEDFVFLLSYDVLISQELNHHNLLTKKLNWFSKNDLTEEIKDKKQMILEMKEIANLNFFDLLQNNWAIKKELYLLKQKHNLIKDQLKIEISNKELNISSYEKQLIFRKIYRQRIDYDLKLLNLFNNDQTFGKDGEILNGIEKNRIYNHVLELCLYKLEKQKLAFKQADSLLKNHGVFTSDFKYKYNVNILPEAEKQQLLKAIKIKKQGIRFTPQDLAKSIYQNSFEIINYKNQIKNIQQKNFRVKELIKELNYEKKLEIFLLKQKTGIELEKEFEKHKRMSQSEEIKEYQPYLNMFISNFKSRIDELNYEAKSMLNWQEFDKMMFDISIQKENSIDFNQDNLVIENNLEKNEVVRQNIKEEIVNFGINFNLINQVNIDKYIESNNLELLDSNQNYKTKIEQEINNDFNYSSLFLTQKQLPNEKANFFEIENPHINIYNNFYIANEIEHQFNENQRQREIELLITLFANGFDIDNKCKELKISKSLINQAVYLRKTKDITKKQQIEHLISKRI